MTLRALYQRVAATVIGAEQRVRSDLVVDQRGAWLLSYDRLPAVWETAEALGIVSWQADDYDLLNRLATWLIDQRQPDHAFAPWPDISSRLSYVEPSCRVMLSLAPACTALGGPPHITAALAEVATWLVSQQDASGGWGSRRGFGTRVNPSTFAVQALLVGETAVGTKHEYPQLAPVLDAARTWFQESANEDGGYGLRPGAESNPCSSGHAAWALDALDERVPSQLTEYLLRAAAAGPENLPDPIDDPARAVGGRFELLLLGKPLSLIGLLLATHEPFSPTSLELVEGILADAREGVWWVPGDRYIWPTYFHVAALRLWTRLYWASREPFVSGFQQFDTVPQVGQEQRVLDSPRAQATEDDRAGSDATVLGRLLTALYEPVQVDEYEVEVSVEGEGIKLLRDRIAQLHRSGRLVRRPEVLRLGDGSFKLRLTHDTLGLLRASLESEAAQ